ncbi:MAG: hypothetical protein O3C70_00740 [Actinomycetota bacterium]|nr:hypothetical protein [Actinomycetota bacterium]
MRVGTGSGYDRWVTPIRQYLPWSRDLATFADRELDQIAAELDERLHETLGWMAPAEEFNVLHSNDRLRGGLDLRSTSDSL